MRTMSNTFADWLLGEIRERNMSQSDLARASGVTRAAISDVVNGRRMPGKVLLNGVARALSIPPEQVFRVAGILPPSDGVDDEIERIIHEANKLNAQDKAEVLAFIRMKINLGKKKNG